MFALTIDQRSSRAQADRVPELLQLLKDVPTALPFERTAGDEVQGLIVSSEAVILAIERVMHSRGWSLGLGIGAVEMPLPGSVREARGPALLRARDAVDAAKRSAAVHVAVHSSAAVGVESEALLRLIGVVLQRRTPAQWRVIEAVAAAEGRAAAAADLGITVQAISKSLLASADDIVRDIYPLLARLLTEADERSLE